MDTDRGFGKYLRTARDYAVEYSYLGFSALFSGTGIYLAAAASDDLEKVGFGLLGAGITQAVYGTCRRLREWKKDKERALKERELELQLRRMEQNQRRMAEDQRKLTEQVIRNSGRRIRITAEVVEEMNEVDGDIECKLQAIKDAAPDNPNSSVQIDAVEFRKYLRERTTPPGGLPGDGEPPCLPGYPTEEI